MRRSTTFILSLTLLVTGCKEASETPPAEAPPAEAAKKPTIASGDSVTITEVIKGDELAGEKDGAKVTLRLLGIHSISPTAKLGSASEQGKAARDWVATQVVGKSLSVTPGRTPKDDFERHLVYATLDGKDFNQAVIEAGQGVVYTEFPFAREAEYLAVEKVAREAKTGLWQNADATELITSLRRLWAQTRAVDGKEVPVDVLAAEPAAETE